jgi:hypothetical protein
MRKVDLEALRRALRMVRTFGPEDADQIERMLTDRSKLDVAQFAAFSCQAENLRLLPWQPPPCWADVDGPEPLDRHPTDGHRAAWHLARRLRDAGLSIYEPDPVAALRGAEARGREPPFSAA